MELASKVNDGEEAFRRQRTFMLRPTIQPQREARDSVGNFFAPRTGRVVSRLKKFFLRLAQPRVLFVLGVFTIAFAVITVQYYSALAGEIDARLAGNSFDNSVGIFSSPFKVSVGDHLPIDELAAYLHASGYQQKSGADNDNSAGSFTIDGNSVEIHPGRTASIQLGLNSVRISIDGTGRVTSLKGAQSGERLPSAYIEGELLAAVRDGDRRKKIAVQFTDIPETLRLAVLAVEDRRFFTHNGIDWRGIARALKADIDQGGVVQGGSTLTQQLIKNAFLSSDRTFSRKFKEAAMAVILESRLSKEQIFTLYCNDVYLGQSGTFAINGFAQAAQVYFDKDIKDLTLAESAFLAGLIHAPNRYVAHRDQERALERRNLVLDVMAETESITDQQAEAAKREPLQIKKRETGNDYGTSYFIDYAQRFADERFGSKGAISRQRIYTTMDPRLQRVAHEAVMRQTAKLDKLYARPSRKGEQQPRVQAALVALDAHTGQVLAMVGGRSYDESQLNRATDAKRQPGSTFKPFVYASALGMRSYTAATLISDTPQTFTYDGGRSQYKPSNYHGSFTNRDVTLREALARSMNVPAVDLAMRVGLGNIATVAENCGLERPRPYPSMALGTSEVTPLELAGAYTAFANEGTALRPTPIKSVIGVDKSGVGEKVSATSARVFSPQVAYLMTNMMQSVVDAGTASKLRAMGIKGAIAGKTGTSNDGWFVGYTPSLICVVWVGFDNNKDLQLKASDAALPLWADFVKQAVDLRPELGGNSFPRPGGISTVDIDPTTGLIASEECAERRQEIFVAGTEPFATCSHRISDDEAIIAGLDEPAVQSPGEDQVSNNSISLEVCAETGLIASSTCPRTSKRTFDIGNEPLDLCRAELHTRQSYAQPPITEPLNGDEGKTHVEGRGRVKAREGQELRSLTRRP
jgi:penicillin-binding protein 1B